MNLLHYSKLTQVEQEAYFLIEQSTQDERIKVPSTPNSVANYFRLTFPGFLDTTLLIPVLALYASGLGVSSDYRPHHSRGTRPSHRYFSCPADGGDCCRGTDNRLGRKSSRNRDRSGINPRYYGPGFGNNSDSVEAYLVCRTTTPMLQFSVKG